MLKIYRIALYCLILLGAIHSVFTIFLYESLNADALWFFGTGLSYIFMGLYNLAALKVKIAAIFNMAVVLNFIGTIFTIAITYILKEPQAYLAMVLVIFIFIYSVMLAVGSINK